MMREIIEILTQDAELMSLIERIEPLETTFLGDCVLYEVTPVSDDCVTRMDRIKFTVVAYPYAKAEAVEQKLRSLLLTFADQPRGSILQAEASGGGSLYDVNRCKYHRILYINLLTRSRTYGT